MSYNYTQCHYHPDRMAVTVCERCRRPICLEDKRNYRKKHTGNTGQNAYSYYTNHDYCILCNASQLRSDASPLSFLIFLPFIIIFFFIFGGLAGFILGSGSFGSIFFLFILIMILFGVGSFLSARTKAEAAENDAMIFKSNLYSHSDSSSRPAFNYYKNNPLPDSYEDIYGIKAEQEIKNDPNLFSIVCFECGAHIDLQDKFCPNCGDSTKEELMNYYQIRS